MTADLVNVPSADCRHDVDRAPLQAVMRLMMAVLCLVWGSTWIVIKGGLRDLPPMTSAGVRFALAALIMIGVAAALSRREGGRRPPLWLTLVQGTFNFAISYGIVYQSETLLPSGLVSLIWGVYPIMQASAGHLFLEEERLRPLQWLGFGGALLGLVLLFRTDLQGFGSEGVPTALLLLLSPASAVVGTTLVKRYGGGVSSTLLNRNGMFVCAGLLLTMAFLFERRTPADWTLPAIGSVVYLAVAGTVLTFSLYFWLLRYAPAHQLGLIGNVTPVIALFLGWAFGGESITWWTVGGAALILAGVMLVVLSTVPRRPALSHGMTRFPNSSF